MQILTSSTSNQSALMDYSGYYFDGADNFNTWRSNSYAQRRDIFQADNGKFTGKPRTFIGPLYHCLQSCGTGIPPDKLMSFFKL